MQRYDIYTDCFDHIVHEETADGEWVRYDDVHAEIARPRAVAASHRALIAASRSAVRRAESKLAASEMAGVIKGWKTRAEKAEAERDQALARAASAAMEMREWAANECKWHSDKLVETIRALPIVPDAQKALDKMLAKARENAIREAAELVKDHFPGTFYASSRTKCLRAILALLNDGGRDE